jgi:hypothetical protein
LDICLFDFLVYINTKDLFKEMTTVTDAAINVFDETWTYRLEDSIITYTDTDRVSYDKAIIRPILEGLLEEFPASIRYNVRDIAKKCNITRQFEFVCNDYAYLLRKSMPSRAPRSLNFRGFIRENSPDGVYIWMVCMYQGTLGIYYKPVFPVVNYSAKHESIAYDVCNGVMECIPTNTVDTFFTILACGQFTSTTQPDGLKTININLQSSSGVLSICEYPIASPNLDAVIDILFRCAGPSKSNTVISYNVELEAMSYIPDLETLPIAVVRSMTREYGLIYGYVVYEFNILQPNERRAFNKSKLFAFAKYISNRAVYERTINLLSKYQTLETTVDIEEYAAGSTAILYNCRPLDNAELMAYML